MKFQNKILTTSKRICFPFYCLAEMTDTDCNLRKIHSSDDEQKIENDYDSQIAAWESQKEELFFA